MILLREAHQHFLVRGRSRASTRARKGNLVFGSKPRRTIQRAVILEESNVRPPDNPYPQQSHAYGYGHGLDSLADENSAFIDNAAIDSDDNEPDDEPDEGSEQNPQKKEKTNKRKRESANGTQPVRSSARKKRPSMRMRQR
jgi:hypothetical protein